MDYRIGLMLVAFAATGPGCGPSAGDGDSSGGSSTGGQPTTSASAGSVTETSVGDSTGTAVVCEDYFDEVATSPATIEIRNVGAEPLLFNDPCFGFEYVQMMTPSELQWPPDFCSLTCQNAFTEGCIDCGACAEAAYTVVGPGQTLTIEWDGRLFERLVAPVECYDGAPCAPSCQQARAAYEETVTITAEAITQADCMAVLKDPLACQCEAGASGPCEAWGTGMIDPTVQASIDIAPGTSSIVVEIGG